MHTGSCLCGAFAAATLLVACGTPGAPEDEIRALVDQAEVAAEERNASQLGSFIADDYRDDSGRGAEDLRRLLRGYLVMHQSIRLLTRIDRLEVLGPDVARISVSVGMLGREASAASALDLAADAYQADLRLARVNGDWLITHAAWRRAGGGS